MDSLLIRRILVGGALAVAVVALGLVAWVAVSVQGLPSEAQLADYEPPITTRVHAGDGSLIAEFAREHRIFVPIEAIPDHVKNAFLSAEDKKFYEHGGIDFQGLMRATATNILSIFTGDRMQGASTITQQVAKNMLLTSDRTISRKVKEAFLAQRIERAFSKDRILELYLNEIYLGQRAYGVAAAALNYFDKPLAELTLAEAAYLAALPKGPNNYHPIRRKERAIERRNYVIGQMRDNGFVTPEEAEAAFAADLVVTDRLAGDRYVMSAHFVEELRRQVLELYGEKRLYDEGLSIRSTLDTAMQVAAARALRKGLDDYDRRQGWRGPLDQINLDGDVERQLAELPEPPGASGWRRAVVTELARNSIKVRLEGGDEAQLIRDDLNWVAQGVRRDKSRALKAGSAVYVAAVTEPKGRYTLKQVPEVEGGIVAMDANTGRVFAMVGGYSFGRSEYNRVTQARRQPGSAFKPIVYASALDYGLTPATLVADEPFSIIAGDGKEWNPENYTKEFYGPTTLRTGLEKSRNLMTIRLAYEMGMERVSEYATRLGSHERLDPLLANSLGAGETTLIRLVGAYAAFVNGGRQVRPVLFDRVQNRYGDTIFPTETSCYGCSDPWSGQDPPSLPDERTPVLDPITAFQITSMLEGALVRGTGTAARVETLALAGKTGTTNDYKDAWFVGFSPNVVIGVWVGFDTPKSMGEGETGGRVAAPIFRDFAAAAIKPDDAPLFRRPSGVRIVRIDAKTGLLPGPTTEQVIEEYFRPDTEPVADFLGTQEVFGQSAMIDQSALGSLMGVFTNDAALPPGAEGAPAPPGGLPQGGPGGATPPPGGPTPMPRQPTPPPQRSTQQEESLGGIY